MECQGYREHLLNYVDEEDVSTDIHPSFVITNSTTTQAATCTGLQALAQANRRFNKGLAATGVGIALDARHGFILPTGVGDLQKGER